MTHIVKRKGHKQEFDERKLYASVYAACLSAHVDKEEVEATANLVCREIKKWMSDREEITSDEIFRQAAEELMALNKDAAFMYTTHRDVS
ncbi:hypothetical protein A3B45_04310 [Candidatus Daviesbacteria bacterium RIFCSPLOWO2_01_FULL_39_12]|uniref:ATP-cone domain-containing protein n=1 Tax=Candidatus Daviesbacteria bacterium RIFCSPLOWO2_01_FULL_39_12 TaxID=1797785 RepID=A0A1F5KNG7_9BACT|nr:MAG: hypothetical protein A3D79_00665 [Candidatus Daviesbacteria bacterium RIFCSPHIGHO2_02_FULL_39_8]OGE42400.1 MAG: hypothetical protein A3B45_04310 [Candidatus Daviesbacteria bacterium RIFCSPLOWO2_01_FULL_39_12]